MPRDVSKMAADAESNDVGLKTFSDNQPNLIFVVSENESGVCL